MSYKATVEIDLLEHKVAHAYVDGYMSDDGGRALIRCEFLTYPDKTMTKIVGHWEARDNIDDAFMGHAKTLRTLGVKLAQRMGHEKATITVIIEDEREPS